MDEAPARQVGRGEEAAASFAGALAATGYMFPLIKGTEVVAGALLLSNRYVPLALALLAPIVVNIVAFHTFLTPVNPIAWLVLALELYLVFAYRAAFRPMLAARVDAGAVASAGAEQARADRERGVNRREPPARRSVTR
ncbi:hypothetical protein [Sorangium sp. So ce1000]|uniref:hypothetical protein n=1 Tax=Sorangium sp. So ce1000 TaxID=3133325 RepID=UPI003F641DF0